MVYDMIEVVGKYVLEAGIWKFYLALIVFLINLVVNVFVKERGISERIMIFASLILLVVTSILIVAGHIAQLIL